MVAQVILNPYAARWNALKRRAEAEAALRAAGVAYELVLSEGPGHATALAVQAARAGFSPIIAAGGDGTISEVVNGLIEAAPEGAVAGPLGIMALGSANDLVVNLGLPTELGAAARVIAAGKTRTIDLGQVNGRYFDNNSAIGLEPHITLIQQRIPLLHGTARYLLAALLGIVQNPHWTAYLEWEGGSYHGPVSLVTVGNNPVTGGLFYMTPHADPADGKLTFVYGHMPTRLQVLRLFPRTMKRGPGSYVEHPAIHEVHATWLRIRVETPTPMHADGEIQSRALQEVGYRVVPGRLGVLVI